MKKAVLSALGVLLMATAAFAGHPLVTDDTGTQGKGKGQVEVGLSCFYDKEKVDEWTTLKTAGGDLSMGVTIGVLDTVDIVIGLPYTWYTVEENNVRITRENGLSDITFDAKWRFFEKEGWSVAVKPGVSLPSGDEDKGLGAGRAGYRLFLVGTRAFEPFAVHVNVGYLRNENNASERKDIWHASVACEVDVLKDLKLLANAGVERNPDPASDIHPGFALAGFSYNISEKITLDSGIKYGLTAAETDWSVLTGITVRF